MYNWKKWIWPGVITTVVLTAGTTFIKTSGIQGELSSGATNQLSANHNWASVDISGRDITLNGMAPSEDAVAEASQLAKDVYGVRVVSDNTELLPVVKPYDLTAEKVSGKITVSGFAPSEKERANIIEAANKSSGGLEVVDDISLARGNPENVSGINAYAIGALAGLATGTAKVSDTSINVTGTANKVPDYQGTLDYLSNVPSGMEIASQDIKPATISPYTFNAEKSGGKVTLDGYVHSFGEITAVGDKFASANPGATIENNLQIALGSAEGADWPKATGEFPSVLNMLEEGSISVTDADVTYEGRLPNGGTLDAFNSAIRSDSFNGLNIAGISIIEPAKAEESSAPAIPTVSPYVWRISKSESGISVAGSVTSDDERASVIDAVKGATGAADVDDQQTLGLGKPDNLDGARLALAKGMKFLESGSANVAGSSVTVSGAAKNANVKGLVERMITKSMPEGYDLDLAIRAPEANAQSGGKVEFVEKPPVIDPYVWTVAKNADGVTVGGNVVNDTERNWVLGRVQSAIGAGEVKDTQTLGRGKPGALDAARIAVSKGLRFLESGSANITGNDVSIYGKAKNSNVEGLVNRVVTGAMPSGYNTNFFIQVPPTSVAKPKPVKFENKPPMINPYTWNVVKNDNGVTVGGHVVSDSERNQVLGAVKSSIGASAVTDEQVLGRGKPGGLDDARVAVSKGLKILESGSALITGTNVKVFGRAKTKQIEGFATRLITTTIPAGYTSDIFIQVPPAMKKPAPVDKCKTETNALIDGKVIQFETNSSDFIPKSAALVKTLAAKLKECPAISVKVEGHTDSIGSAEYNQVLSNDRAYKVKVFLIDAGVEPSRVKPQGFGETQPIDTNATREGRAKNRRTLISIIK